MHCEQVQCRSSYAQARFQGQSSAPAAIRKPDRHLKAEYSIHRRKAILGAASLLLLAPGAKAAGIEGIKPAQAVEGGFSELRRKNQDFLDKGADAFENSDIVKTLRERSLANRDANKKALQERYCYRQAEMGVGDCAGLRLIPGATKSGKQKTPEWLKAVLQKLGQLPPDEATKSPT